jgi:cytochrome P450
VLPLWKPIKATDGKTDIMEVFVPKGANLNLDLAGLNTRNDVWGKDGEEWKPERWLQELPSSVTDAKLPGVLPQM